MNLVQNEMFKEAKKLGCAAEYDSESSSLRIYLDGEYLAAVTEKDLLCPPRSGKDERFSEIGEKFTEKYCSVKEYVGLYESAPALNAGVAGYRQLGEFNNMILAAKYMPNNQFEFVVWSCTYDHNGVCNGTYVYDYNEAKEVFAAKSGLAPEGLSENEQKTIHTALKYTQANDGTLTYEKEQEIKRLLDKIEDKFPLFAVTNDIPKMAGM